MKSRDIGALPIAEKNGVIGIVTDRDIFCRVIAQGLDPETTAVRDVMTRDVAMCFDDQEVAEAARAMERRRVRRLPVMDRKRKLVGIMSVGDLSQHATHELTGEVEERITHH
jgi:CBS domain-containing protein